MIDRRSVLAGLALGCLTSPALAQTSVPPVVYFMALATRDSDAASIAAFRAGMRERGHVEGRSYVLFERYAAGDIPAAERELRLQSDSPPAVVSNFGEQLAAKRVQLLAEAMPKLRAVGVLHNTVDPVFQRWGEETGSEIRSQGLTAVSLAVQSTSQDALALTLRQARARGVEAIVVVRDFLTASLYRPIAQLSRELGVAVIAQERRYVDAGALMSYGANDQAGARSPVFAVCVRAWRLWAITRGVICRSSSPPSSNW